LPACATIEALPLQRLADFEIIMTAFDEFSKLARSRAQLYRTRETTYIAVRQGESWYLLYSRELLLVEEALDVPPIHIETPSIRAGQFRIAIDESSASEIMERVLAQPGGLL
jgi:hypothetical protein